MQIAQLALAMPINCLNLPAAMSLFIVSLRFGGEARPLRESYLEIEPAETMP
jgi:hypothetical protein